MKEEIIAEIMELDEEQAQLLLEFIFSFSASKQCDDQRNNATNDGRHKER